MINTDYFADQKAFYTKLTGLVSSDDFAQAVYSVSSDYRYADSHSIWDLTGVPNFDYFHADSETLGKLASVIRNKTTGKLVVIAHNPLEDPTFKAFYDAFTEKKAQLKLIESSELAFEWLANL